MLARLAELTLPKHRATRDDQLHLTLFFVGDTDPRQLDEIIESVERSASGIGPITLAPRAVVSLPEHGPPRLLALETDAPTNLLELQRRLAHRLARRPHRADEPFRPHFTLCRYATPGGDCLRDAVSIAPFAVDRVAVVESVLRPTGAQHRVIEWIPLA